jgi:hypothetical protein
MVSEIQDGGKRVSCSRAVMACPVWPYVDEDTVEECAEKWNVRPAHEPTVDWDAALKEFTAYFVRNYPGQNTIISDPTWHAPKIFRAVRHAIKAATSSGTALAKVSETAEAGHPTQPPGTEPADAERYRWLRRRLAPSILARMAGVAKDDLTDSRPEALDIAIDEQLLRNAPTKRSDAG